MFTSGVILALTYVGLVFTRLPKVPLDRPFAAYTGAVLMVLLGVLTLDQAVSAIDFNTIGLLLGMMLLAVVLKQAGLFTFLAVKSVAMAKSPGKLLVAVIVASAVGSAFLVNDVVVLLFTPVVIQACRLQRVNPVPFLTGEGMASNIGSAATIVGNPQNMLIGVTSGISFARFFAHLAPVAAVSLLILLAVMWLFYRRKLGMPPKPGEVPMQGGSTESAAPPEIDYAALCRCIPLVVAVIAAFFASSVIGVGVPIIALTAGVVAIVMSGMKPSQVIQQVDWVLLLFFAGLFVVIGGARHTGLLDILLEPLQAEPSLAGIVSLHLISATVSQVVSNVPLTVLLIPLLEDVPGDVLWLSLSSAATLAGNATIIGSVANIIVAEQAYKDGVLVGFGEFLKVGLVVTVLTLIASVGIILFQYEMGWLI
ncbi:MAG: anion transporter [SAR202 cluster bacterium]|nr:anion transporter [SAR202 cluster bacterium]